MKFSVLTSGFSFFAAAAAAISLSATVAATTTGCADAPGMTVKSAANGSKKGAASSPVANANADGFEVNHMGEGVPFGAEGAGVDTPAVHVAGAIAEACGILPEKEKANEKYTTSFAFDSATIGQEDRTLLAALAKCMSDGPLRGKNVALVGRADARGEDEYNMSLGSARADSVRRYLHDLGVSQERVGATSRGELDAIGSEESGWARDRRVDIEPAK